MSNWRKRLAEIYTYEYHQFKALEEDEDYVWAAWA